MRAVGRWAFRLAAALAAALVLFLPSWSLPHRERLGADGPVARTPEQFARLIAERAAAARARAAEDAAAAPAPHPGWLPESLARGGWWIGDLLTGEGRYEASVAAAARARRLRALKHQRGAAPDDLADWGYLALFREFWRDHRQLKSQWNDDQRRAFADTEALLVEPGYRRLIALREEALRRPPPAPLDGAVPAVVRAARDQAEQAARAELEAAVQRELHALLADFSEHHAFRREHYVNFSFRFAQAADTAVMNERWALTVAHRAGEDDEAHYQRLRRTLREWRTWAPEEGRRGYPNSRYTQALLPHYIAEVERARFARRGLSRSAWGALIFAVLAFPGGMILSLILARRGTAEAGARAAGREGDAAHPPPARLPAGRERSGGWAPADRGGP